MTTILELLTNAPIVPPTPAPESAGVWSPPWYSFIFLAISLTGTILFAGICLGASAWFAQNRSPIMPMAITFGMTFLGGTGIALGNEYSRQVHDDKSAAYWRANSEFRDAELAAIGEAYNVTILEKSPDNEIYPIVPKVDGYAYDVAIQHPDGRIETCELDRTPETYILTCPETASALP